MKIQVYLFLLFLTLPFHLFSQPGPNDPAYKLLVDKAFEHLKANECAPCLEFYKQAFDMSKHSAMSHLRAAICADKCNNKKERDTLIAAAVAIDWSTCKMLLNKADVYPEFRSIIGTDFESTTIAAVKKAAEAAGVNLALADELMQIKYDDQKYRIWIDSVRYEHPDPKSPEYQAFIKEWIKNDSVQMAKIVAIISKYGYPGKSLVGSEAGSIAWLVIQHAPIETQEKYLPMITEAAQKGECRKSDWAYLVDRINMRNGRHQIYGSQVTTNKETGAYMFHPIEDEANVNIRRAEVGLGPLEEYAKMMGVEWALPNKD